MIAINYETGAVRHLMHNNSLSKGDMFMVESHPQRLFQVSSLRIIEGYPCFNAYEVGMMKDPLVLEGLKVYDTFKVFDHPRKEMADVLRLVDPMIHRGGGPFTTGPFESERYMTTYLCLGVVSLSKRGIITPELEEDVIFYIRLCLRNHTVVDSLFKEHQGRKPERNSIEVQSFRLQFLHTITNLLDV